GKAQHEWDFLDYGTLMAHLGANPMPARPVLENYWPEKVVVIAKNDDAEKKNIEAWNKGLEHFNAHDQKAMEADFPDDLSWVEVAFAKDQTKKEMLKGLAEFQKGFSDMKIQTTGVWAAGDYVVVTGRLSGTNDGEVKSMKLKKTGKKFDTSFMEDDKFKNGKPQTVWIFYDGMAFAKQMGMIPPPGADKDKKSGGEKKGDAPKGGGEKKRA